MPRDLASWAVQAPAHAEPGDAPPRAGWQPVTLPDRWDTHNGEHSGRVWYRIEWEQPCVRQDLPLGLAVHHINLAGAVWVNQTLLWRDKNLVEPLSRSWNSPRAFALPASALQQGRNHVWILVVADGVQSGGVGQVHVTSLEAAQEFAREERLFRRVLPGANVMVSGTLGLMFFLLWVMRRQELTYGWYAASALAWVMTSSNLLITETPWPFANSLAWSRWVSAWFGAYVCTAAMFFWHFGGLVRPRRVRAMAIVFGALTLGVVLAPAALYAWFATAIFVLGVSLVVVVCVQFIAHALRTRLVDHLWLAACCAGVLLPMLHDSLMVLGVSGNGRPWTPATTVFITLGMSLVLAGRFTRTLRQVERFNDRLEAEVRLAREDLAQTLQREHALELANVRLNERLSVAHELHDGLGSSLVRSVALVEKAGTALQRHHYLSMFKSLRDDLRLIVDTHGSASAAVPPTPVQWLAPIRHRFGRLFEETAVHCSWSTPPEWPCPLTPRQALGLTRFLEEALTNVIKHSRARALCVRMEALEPGQGLRLSVKDDGVGFDVSLAQQAMGGMGLTSMQARIARIGGALSIESDAGGTRLVVTLRAPQGAGGAAAGAN